MRTAYARNNVGCLSDGESTNSTSQSHPKRIHPSTAKLVLCVLAHPIRTPLQSDPEIMSKRKSTYNLAKVKGRSLLSMCVGGRCPERYHNWEVNKYQQHCNDTVTPPATVAPVIVNLSLINFINLPGNRKSSVSSRSTEIVGII